MVKLPLDSYRIVDFGAAWAGPMGAQLLADMGAEVIKVESHVKMDGLRLGRPLVGEGLRRWRQGPVARAPAPVPWPEPEQDGRDT